MKKILIVVLVMMLAVCGCAKGPKSDKKETSGTENLPVIDGKSETDVANEEAVESETVNESEKEPEEKTEEKAVDYAALSGKIIVVDPGHGIASSSRQEPIAPGSSEKKAAFVSGTSGANQTEEQLNLAVGLKLKAALEEKGAVVHMTRETHECDVSNVDRAKMANELGADIAVRIHADGSENTSAHGVSVLVPGNQYIKNDELITKSRNAGELVLNAFVNSTGAQDRGISVRNDMTGFNWSEVPVILVEMGFMSNPEEDRLMETGEYQDKMVKGMVIGLAEYFAGIAE